MSVDEVVKTILARGHISPTQDELALLFDAPDTHVLAQKILAVHAFNAGEFETSVIRAKKVLACEISRESVSNLISALMKARYYDEALQTLDDHGELLDPLDAIAKKSEICAHKGDWQNAVRFGRDALAVKDAEAPASPSDGLPAILHPYRPERSALSFSLFGSDARYLEGALRNAIIARHSYPGWRVRFYVDDTVPEATLKQLIDEGAQVFRVTGQSTAHHGLFWRFMIEDDETVDIYVVRDADSIISIKERVAVGQWLESGLPFHIMRDHPVHSELMLAGMWGAHRGNIGSMTKRIAAFVHARRGTLNDRAADQKFLREIVWPITRGRACCHDPVFGFHATHRVPSEFDLPGNMHIGQNQMAHMKTYLHKTI